MCANIVPVVLKLRSPFLNELLSGKCCEQKADLTQIIGNVVKAAALSKILEAQNVLLASSGVGNVYMQIFKSELGQTGKSPNAIDLLKKAYSLNNNNLETITWLSGTLALWLSRTNWVRGKAPENMQNNRDWRLAKEVAERGLRIDPKERRLMDALGILHDTAGDHELAREWFIRSSKWRDDPYWHFLVATSWGMSGKAAKAIGEIEQAIKEGASGWFTDVSYGDALQHGGQPHEALLRLAEARKARGMHPMNSYASMHARATIGCFSLYSIVDWLYLMVFLITTERWHSLGPVMRISFLLLFSTLSAFSRNIWFITCRNRVLAKIHYSVLPPDEVVFLHGTEQIQLGDYEAALNFFKICRSICPKSVQVLGNMAFCYAQLGDREKAIQLTNEALSIEPKNEILLWNRKQYESAVELHPRLDVSKKDFHIQ